MPFGIALVALNLTVHPNFLSQIMAKISNICYNQSMTNVTISPRAEQAIRSGVQLLDSRDLKTGANTHGLVTLQTPQGQPVGRAYLSPQHKGCGWVLPDTPQTLDQVYFKLVLSRAKAKREHLNQSERTTAYRLFNQDGDDFGGLTIDRYGDYALFSWYNPLVYSLKLTIVSAFRQVYPELLGGYEKVRFAGVPLESAHLYGEEAPDVFEVLENGVRYSVFLNDGLMTGIFLDQREVRGRLIDGLAAGKSLLNLFSYTAAFSLAAAVGGAERTTSVDLAKRSRHLSEAHFMANNLSIAHHRFVVMDVFDYFKYAQRKGLTYDVIVLDPPSFARNKKQTFSVSKDYHRLVSQALPLLTAGGLLIASTNASNLSLAQFQQHLKKGLGNRSYTILEVQGLPSDFTHNPADDRSNYLKVVTIQVN